MRSTHEVPAQPRGLRRHLQLGAGLALVVLTLTASPAAARPIQSEPAGGVGLRLVDAPAASSEDPRALIYIVDHLAPGTTIERRIEVSNSTDAPQEVALYPAAATIEDGTFLGAEGRTRNELSSWTTVSPPASTVAAGGRVTALVTLAVPVDAAPGEQYGVVWAEVRSATINGGGVAQVSRVGLRLYISVGPGGAPAADFTIDSFTAAREAGGAPVVSASVTNTGGRALDLTGVLQLAGGPGGLSAGPFPVDLGTTLAIGATSEVRVALDDEVPDGPWDAVIRLESGLTERTAEAKLTFPTTGAAAPVAAAPPDDSPTWRLLAVGGGVIILLLVAAGSAAQRRRRNRRWDAHAALWGGTPA